MENKILALKYRPQEFDDLIGQEVITKTITNAIELNKTPNAYLLTGIRGVGKTTTARLIAKKLNCLKYSKKKFDCNSKKRCSSCEEISNTNNIDVLEMDAASKTGIDDVREIIESSKYSPVNSRYKIFIIDEVHMLSKQAFNGLLKTLEEPPPSLKFILATTELNKIPATIQSRSQTLHFRLLDADQIKSHVSTVCEKESFSIEPAALNRLVQVANGGMRDALSLLDQLMSISSSTHISLSDITELLGSLDESEMLNFLSQCFDFQPQAYHLLKDYMDQGMDVFQLLQILLQNYALIFINIGGKEILKKLRK